MIKNNKLEAIILFSSFASSMGIGRFVFTPILPAMKHSLNMLNSDVSLVIAMNFLGYFIGALFLLKKPTSINKRTLIISMFMVSCTLLFMPLYESYIWFSFVRLVAGFSSSLAFICLAARVLDISRKNHVYGAAFGGVGFGIVLSGVITFFIKSYSEWDRMWYVSSFFSFLSVIPVFFITGPKNKISPGDPVFRENKLKENMLIVSYFLEGAGYIIIGTYLVSLISNRFGSGFANLNWIIAGVLTIPSIFIWSLLLKRNKVINMLLLSYFIQFLSPLMFVFSGSIYGFYLASSFFGITFMGITKLSMQEASSINMKNASSKMTLSYSAGQLFGPLVVSPLIKGSYENAFIISAFFISICIAICLYLKHLDGRLTI